MGGIIDIQRGSECSRVVIDGATVSDIDAEKRRCEKGRGCFGGGECDCNCDGIAIAMDWDAVSRRGRPRQYLRPQGSVGEGRSLLLAGG